MSDNVCVLVPEFSEYSKEEGFVMRSHFYTEQQSFPDYNRRASSYIKKNKINYIYFPFMCILTLLWFYIKYLTNKKRKRRSSNQLTSSYRSEF